MKRLRLTYRKGVEVVVLMPVIREMLALETVPPLHYPTEVLSVAFCGV